MSDESNQSGGSGEAEQVDLDLSADDAPDAGAEMEITHAEDMDEAEMAEALKHAAEAEAAVGDTEPEPEAQPPTPGSGRDQDGLTDAEREQQYEITEAERQDLKDQAQEQAKELLSEAPGETQGERAQTALQEVQKAVRELSQHIGQAKQEAEQKRAQARDLKKGLDHLDRTPPGVDVVLSRAGGVSFEVPPESEDDEGAYTRDELRDDIVETIQETEQQAAEKDERTYKLERGHVKAEETARLLQQFAALSE